MSDWLPLFFTAITFMSRLLLSLSNLPCMTLSRIDAWCLSARPPGVVSDGPYMLPTSDRTWLRHSTRAWCFAASATIPRVNLDHLRAASAIAASPLAPSSTSLLGDAPATLFSAMTTGWSGVLRLTDV